MNNRSFMRIADVNKIAQVEQTAIKYVVERGYGRASVAEIAKAAEVSKGYLYRHYKNKKDMVQTMLTRHIDKVMEQIKNGLDQNISVDLVLSSIIYNIFSIAENNPDHIKFIYVLMHDYNFQLENSQRQKIKNITKQFYKLGTRQGLIDTATTEEEIFTIIVIYPIDFINLRYKSFFGTKGWNDNDLERVSTFCINALKK